MDSETITWRHLLHWHRNNRHVAQLELERSDTAIRELESKVLRYEDPVAIARLRELGDIRMKTARGVLCNMTDEESQLLLTGKREPPRTPAVIRANFPPAPTVYFPPIEPCERESEDEV